MRVKATGHSFADTWEGDDTNHWHTCSKCKVAVDIESHVEETISAVTATCLKTGLTEGKKCSVCNKILDAQVNTEKLAHSFVTTWSKDATNHWKNCSACGEKGQVSKHTYDAGKVTKQATDTAEGTKIYTCSVCGQTKIETIPKKNDTAPTPTPTVELKKGAKVSDTKTKATYQVTKADSTKGEVTYMSSTNKNATKITK